MLVSELFTRLSYGVFSNLSIGMDGNGSIATDKKPKMVGYLNEALLKLHSRFILRQEKLTILQDVSLRLYRMSSTNALSNASPAPGQVLFIQDSEGDPYQNDLIKILSIRDSCGDLVPLNDIEHTCSLFTPQPDVLEIREPTPGKLLDIFYQARHPIIGPTAYTAEIDLPPTLEVALIAYIAHLTYFHMNGQEHTARAADHLNTFEAACTEVIARDLVNSSTSQTNTRFEKWGWV